MATQEALNSVLTAEEALAQESAAEILPDSPETSTIANHAAVTSHRCDSRTLSPVEPDSENQLETPNYRPSILTDWALYGIIIYSVFVLGLLIALSILGEFRVLSYWSYFVVQVLPVVLGTITASLMDAVTTTISRITPFMLCAGNGSPYATAGNTILRSYFPLRNLWDFIDTKNWLLGISEVLFISTFWILGLKASLLSMDDYGNVSVTTWAVLALLCNYACIVFHTVWVFFYLRKRRTGLQWDPVSIADYLVYFRHSNFLDNFAGSAFATRNSMMEKLKNIKLRLGFWERENAETWYGFGEIRSSQLPTEEVARDYIELVTTTGRVDMDDCTQRRSETIKRDDLTQIRYNSTVSMLQPLAMYLFTIGAVILLALFIVGIILNDSDSGILIPINYDLSSFIFQFIPTIIVSFYTFFWEDVALFSALTEPFVALDRGGTAKDTLLLDYTCQPRYITVYSALQMGHNKVARTAFFAILQRFLPIAVGSSVSINSVHDGSELYFSVPIFSLIIIWLGLYAFLIPYEVLNDSLVRCLPRNFLTIADLLSWTSDSSLLRVDNFNSGQESGILRENPLNVAIRGEGEESKQWYMQARLGLQMKIFRFGLTEVSGYNSYTIGITDGNIEPLDHSKLQGIRRRKPKQRNSDEERGAQRSYDIVSGDGFIRLGPGASDNAINLAAVQFQHQEQEQALEEPEA